MDDLRRVSWLVLVVGISMISFSCGNDPVAGTDAPPEPGPPVNGEPCGFCRANSDCNDGHFCVKTPGGQSACLRNCNAAARDCPVGFECLVAPGGSVTVCTPRTATCCVDEDGDEFGTGQNCQGPDCDDSDGTHWSDCASCNDADGDSYGVGCDLGADCDDSDPNHWRDCGSCTDVDGDGYGVGCDGGADCDDLDPQHWSDCGACVDNDGDGFGRGCDLGSDCADNNPNCISDCTDGDFDGYCITSDCNDAAAAHWDDCGVCVDADGDGYGVGCNLGDDCDDTAELHWSDCGLCFDQDGDGRGGACDLGADCDDTTAAHWQDCALCSDADGDDYGAYCDLGDDCAPLNPSHWDDCATCVDPDADNYGPGCNLGDDCNNLDTTSYPGAPELCDGADNDCDPSTIDGVSEAWYLLSCDGPDADLCEEGTADCIAGAYSCSDTTDDNLEVCNGLDDDCDGLFDTEQLADDVLCPPGPNATGICGGAAGCLVNACDPGYWDVNGQYADGCECAEEPVGGVGPSCTAPIDLGVLHDDIVGDQINVTGNVPGIGREVWYRFLAVDDNWQDDGCDTFNVRVSFVTNPGTQFGMRFQWKGCDATPTTPGSTAPGNLGTGDQLTWFTDFNAPADPRGECPCTNQVDAAGHRLTDPGSTVCTDNSAEFLVGVFLLPTATPSCDLYEIAISNGL